MRAHERPLLTCLIRALCVVLLGLVTACGDDASPESAWPAADGDASAGDRDSGNGRTGRTDVGSHDVTDPDATDDGATDEGVTGDGGDADGSGDGGDADATGDGEGDGTSDATADGADDTVDACDEDDDGFLSIECGGDDCDDNEPRVSPAGREGCDFADNDCNGTVNDGLRCTFYAHTADELYLIDPFLGTQEYVTEVPNLFDFDTDIAGTLYGISPHDLHRFDADAGEWNRMAEIGTLSAGVNGFAIDSTGRSYATGGNDLFFVDLETGETEHVGEMGGGFISAGDCVVDKNDVLFMTSDHRSDQNVLVRVDAATADSEAIGPIGFRGVYGLTAAWGFMFGVTSSGEVLEIDPSTGRGRLLHTFDDRRWYGAASASTR